MNKKDKRKWPALRLEIWEEREHISELSGKPLLPRNHMLWYHQFLHVLPHDTYPSEGLNKDNIMLALPEEHERQNEFDAFNKRFEELRSKHNRESKYNYGKWT